jgi:hypothetical protein
LNVAIVLLTLKRIRTQQNTLSTDYKLPAADY